MVLLSRQSCIDATLNFASIDAVQHDTAVYSSLLRKRYALVSPTMHLFLVSKQVHRSRHINIKSARNLAKRDSLDIAG